MKSSDPVRCLLHTDIIKQLFSAYLFTFVWLMFYWQSAMNDETRMWANAQHDGRPVEHRWRPLFNAAKFG